MNRLFRKVAVVSGILTAALIAGRCHTATVAPDFEGRNSPPFSYQRRKSPNRDSPTSRGVRRSAQSIRAAAARTAAGLSAAA